MEQREAERGAKTRIPTAFSLPNVGKSFANFQRGSARRRIGRGSSRSTLYFGWGVGVGFLCADALGPFYGFRQNREGPRTSAAPPRWKGQHRKANFPPPASHCSPSSSRVSPLFYCLTLSPPSPFPATAETKKSNKKKQQNGCQTSEKRKNEAEGKAAPALCAFTVFCVLMKAECSNEGGKKKTLFSRTC